MAFVKQKHRSPALFCHGKGVAMSAPIATTEEQRISRSLVAAGLIIAAWMALYGPVYIDFLKDAWMREENGHAPFILAIALGVGWARLNDGGLSAPTKVAFGIGLVTLGLGLLMYALGIAGDIELFLSASQGVTALGIILTLLGFKGVKRLWFPLILMVYLIIWPGWAIDVLTAPLKIFVSAIVSETLFSFGLPVAQSGAIIAAGPYELLVADACAGLNSLIALTAVGAVYLYAAKRKSRAVNLIVLAALIPLAVAANILRVGILVLLTYYLGYDAGQGFLHETAGLVMFAVALAGVFLIDSIAAFFFEARS